VHREWPIRLQTSRTITTAQHLTCHLSGRHLPTTSNNTMDSNTRSTCTLPLPMLLHLVMRTSSHLVWVNSPGQRVDSRSIRHMDKLQAPRHLLFRLVSVAVANPVALPRSTARRLFSVNCSQTVQPRLVWLLLLHRHLRCRSRSHNCASHARKPHSTPDLCHTTSRLPPPAQPPSTSHRSAP